MKEGVLLRADLDKIVWRVIFNFMVAKIVVQILLYFLNFLLSIIHIWNQRLAATCVESDMNTEQKCPLYHTKCSTQNV